MENIDKTISAICDWIQKDLEKTSDMEQPTILPEMTKALASLVEARAKEPNFFSSAVKESKNQ